MDQHPSGTFPGPWGDGGGSAHSGGWGWESVWHTELCGKVPPTGRGVGHCRGCLPFQAADPELLPQTSCPPAEATPRSTRPSYSLFHSVPDRRTLPWSPSTFLCVSRKSPVLWAIPFFKRPEARPPFNLGSGGLRGPRSPPLWKAWARFGSRHAGRLTVQLVLREAGPAQVPHGVQGYGAGGRGGQRETAHRGS